MTRRVSELEGLKSEFPDRSIEIVNADANEAISALCQNTNWRSTRGVVFLDPYGLQLTWDTLIAISRTKALDIWVLFPSGMGLNRLLTKTGEIPQEWQDTLDRSLGTHEWRVAFYRNEDVEATSLREPADTQLRTRTREKMEKYYLDRLRSIFPVVSNACVRLTNSKDQTMYLLCFASANPHQKVKSLATKLAGWAAKV